MSLGKALAEKGLMNERDLLLLFVRELRIPTINLSKYRIDPNLKELIPERIARQYRIVPVSKLENTITIALSDPFDLRIIDDIKNITVCEVDIILCTETDILQILDQFYGSNTVSSATQESKELAVANFEIIKVQEGAEGTDIVVDAGEQAPIIRIVNLVIKEAIKQRASDIHIEPTFEELRVRYRIDGILRDVLSIPKGNQNAVLIRIKIMSRMDITGTRKPQDGRFKLRIDSQEIDFRVSSLPTTHGEKVVMRLLDKKNLDLGLNSLGFSPQSFNLMREGIKKPFGMILVTGPTGSGKSTTLYSVINELNTVDKNIITIEDPVEYLIEGLTQIQAHTEIGLTFASGLRSILRQSPDIVMVGEIRDTETADIAIKASLTGQLVFSTLHTNDTAGSLTRLVDMNVEPFLVASSLILVCAQRLCRKICPYCKEKASIPDKVLKDWKIESHRQIVFYKGKGCDFCRQTGYSGRIAVTEILKIEDTIREMLIRGESSFQIKNYAIKHLGMMTLWQDIVQKFTSGMTSMEEVIRIVARD